MRKGLDCVLEVGGGGISPDYIRYTRSGETEWRAWADTKAETKAKARPSSNKLTLPLQAGFKYVLGTPQPVDRH